MVNYCRESFKFIEFTITMVSITLDGISEGRLVHVKLIMVALWNRADHYIFAPWFLLSSFFFFLA